MMALTIWQPMAWAIAEGHKRIENRTWIRPRLIGQLMAIHAGEKWHEEHAEQMRDLLGLAVPTKVELVHGAVIAVVTVRGFVHEDDTQANAKRYQASNFFSGPYGWILSKAKKLNKPVPCKGRQGLWTLPVGVCAEVEAQL